MIKEIIMPKLSNTQIEGQLVKWLKNEGDVVKENEPLVEILTDKVSMVVESTASGFVRKLLLEPGDVVPIGTVIGFIATEADEVIPEKYSKMTREIVLGAGENKGGSDSPQKDFSVKNFQKQASEDCRKKEKAKITPRARKMIAQHGINQDEIVPEKGVINEKAVEFFLKSKEIPAGKATPMAKKLSASRGIDLNNIMPSDGRRITKQDVEKLLVSSEDDFKVVPYTGVRKIIGDRLSESKVSAPHIYFEASIDMTSAIGLKEKLASLKSNDGSTKIGLNPIILIAVVKTLVDFPEVNSSLREGGIYLFKKINLGVAVDTPSGLVVPKIRDAGKLGLRQLAWECQDIVSRARSGGLNPEELQGGTFTVSNLGMYKIERFTAIINPPESAILAVSAIREIPVVGSNKEIEPRPLMNVCLSVDHRVIDGALAAKFVDRLKFYLENVDLLCM
jgi:pyruvate dehydrogenase E2 component (dihydrolipoamide acetyltransferase)